ncbi:MAG: cupin domain-containing protein [Xanthobacteraceae bacterium]
MTSKAEKIGAALARAVKATAAIVREEEPKKAAVAPSAGPSIYRTNIRNVPKVEDLTRDDGWVDMHVQFLIDKTSAGADHLVGWSVLKPGARHERHRHCNCDGFFIVIKGRGHIYSDLGEEPSIEGDVVYSPRGSWHGFNNSSSEDVVLVWGWMGVGSIADSGYQVDPAGRKE